MIKATMTKVAINSIDKLIMLLGVLDDAAATLLRRRLRRLG
jgi:hypothetical protein